MLIGTRKSGKSYALRHMLTDMLLRRQLKFGLVFTSTKFNGAYNWLPDKYVFDEFDKEKFRSLPQVPQGNRGEGRCNTRKFHRIG